MICHTTPCRTALAGFAILALSIGIGRFAFTPMLPVMQAEGLLDIGGGGTLASVHFVGYALGALFAGRLAAMPRPILIASLALIGLSTIAMGMTDNFAIWLVARWIAGVCSALALIIVSTHLVRHLAEAGRSDLQGLVFAGVGGGIACVGLAMLGFMAVGMPSDLGWWFFGLVTLISAGAVSAVMGAEPFVSAAPAQAAGKVRFTRSWRIILPYGAMGAGYVIPAIYLPVIAQQSVAQPLVFGWSWPLFGAAAVVSTLLSARLHRRFSNRRIWMASQCVMAIGLALPAFWPNIAAVVTGGICVGGTFMVVTMAGMREAHRLSDGPGAQHLIAAMTAAFAFGQIIAPVLAGWAYAVSGSFTDPLLLGSAVLVLTLMPMLNRAADNQG